MTGPLSVQDTTAAIDLMADLQGGLTIPLMERLMGIVGLATMIGIAVLMSSDRKRISWRLVGML